MPPPKTSPRDRAEARLSLMEALAEEHRTHAKDCQALASALEGFHGTHRVALETRDPETHAEIEREASLRTRMQTAMGDIMTVGMACQKNEAFRGMQARLSGSRTELRTAASE